MPTVAQRIARFTSTLSWEALPEVVQEKTRVSLMHNLGMALAGQPLLAIPSSYIDGLGNPAASATSRLLISGRRVDAETAALVNGALMHARAQDDVYFPGLTHAGSAMIPAALALAESRQCSGTELLTALVAGYEAAGALSQGFGMNASQRGLRPTGMFGVFASTAACARLLHLSAEQTANALAMAAHMAAGTSQPWLEGSQEWQLHIGLASRNGLTAARLAAAGLRGASEAFEGSAGFYRAFCDTTDGTQAIGQDLGQHWRSLEVTYKPYAVCAILQMPVMQAISMANEADLQPDQIRSVLLRLPPVEAAVPGTNSKGPYRGVGATLMSAPFCLAMALVHRAARGEDLKKFQDPDLTRMIGRIEVVSDEHLKTRGFVLEIETLDGRLMKRMSQTEGEPFNWNAQDASDQLRIMADEMAVAPSQLEKMIKTTLSAHKFSVQEIVSNCVIQP